MESYSISVEDVSVTYKVLNSVSIKDQVLFFKNGRKRTEYMKALDNISFTVERGQVVGLIGSNGAGKSTLLKTLAGVFAPDSGSIKLFSSSISLLTLRTGFEPNLSGVQNIYWNGILLGLRKNQIAERLNQIIEFADIGDFVYRPVRTYSSGMRSRLAFAIASNVEPDILLLDEMMGVGDQNFRQKSTERIHELMQSQRTVILAAHNMSTIKELCQLTIWLDKGRLVGFGETQEIVNNYLDMVRGQRVGV